MYFKYCSVFELLYLLPTAGTVTTILTAVITYTTKWQHRTAKVPLFCQLGPVLTPRGQRLGVLLGSSH